jgi:hypothetical protein
MTIVEATETIAEFVGRHRYFCQSVFSAPHSESACCLLGHPLRCVIAMRVPWDIPTPKYDDSPVAPTLNDTLPDHPAWMICY